MKRIQIVFFCAVLCLTMPFSLVRYAWGEAGQTFRVCADPDNLPFSNRQLQGFENHIATLMAREFQASPTYTWQPQRRGFVRGTLDAKRCDVIIGVPTGYGLVLWTKPYYRSTFVVISRQDRNLQVTSLDDPVLRRLRIGVHQNSPVDIGLGLRGIVMNVVGYSIWYDDQERYPAKIIEDVTAGKLDVAIVWGAGAGYFVQQQAEVLRMQPITVPRPGGNGNQAVEYTISMGVRKTDTHLKDRLDAVLSKKQAEIRQILERYGVPLVADPKP
jgi:mxaJ protein